MLKEKNTKSLESHRKVDQECSLSKSLLLSLFLFKFSIFFLVFINLLNLAIRWIKSALCWRVVTMALFHQNGKNQFTTLCMLYLVGIPRSIVDCLNSHILIQVTLIKLTTQKISENLTLRLDFVGANSAWGSWNHCT